MKTRWILTVLVATALLVGAGLGLARQHPSAGDGWDMGEMGDMVAMHDSEAMREMHAQMPTELRERCDEQHAQMGRMQEQMAGMMNGGSTGGGMMNGGSTGGGMMNGGSMAAHHGPGG